ncbi:MAG TPA: ribonuclease Z [Syntrophobacteraceae bacterium]|nr:ribonuclease Z [Syntrophobacteraceae bacterium]
MESLRFPGTGVGTIRRQIQRQAGSPMECVLLGTGGMMPMPDRLLTSLAVRLGGCCYLFDAGEGVQLGLKRTHLGMAGLKVIAITHLHADHCLGLLGLLMLRAQLNHPEPLTILGPPGLSQFVQQNQEILRFHINYPIHCVEWQSHEETTAYQDPQVRIVWRPLEHTRFCLGFRLEEHPRPGKFHPERARALKIPEGPLWGALQRGETVSLPSGPTITPSQVLGTPRRGRHICYAVDTRPCSALEKLCRAVDMAFVEGMFLPEDGRHADAKGHLTVVEAADIAHRAGARRAVLVHISPRYGEEDLPELERAAREHFSEAQVGRDFDRYLVGYAE